MRLKKKEKQPLPCESKVTAVDMGWQSTYTISD